MTKVTRPFAAAPFVTPFTRTATPAVGPAWSADHASAAEPYTYTLLRQGPPVEAYEVEQPGVASIEIMILWGSNALHVAHLTPPRDFSVGEEAGPHHCCDFFLPAEKIGATRLPVIRCQAGGPMLVVPAEAEGWWEAPGQPRVALNTVQGEPLVELSGGRAIPLLAGARATLCLGGFVFQVGAVNAAKRLPTGVGASADWSVPAFFGMSTLAHASFIAAMAFFIPPGGIIDDEAAAQDRSYLVRQYLDAAAERERTERPSDETTSESRDEHEGGTGQRAIGEEGKMGNTLSNATNRRYGIKGPKDNPEPHLARGDLLKMAENFGMIGLLAGGSMADPKAPTAPWGRETSLGTDEVSAQGNMWGDEIGDAAGLGGLGLSGVGEGGGGYGYGVGLGNVGTIGHGAGTGLGQGFGNGVGKLGQGTHHPKGPVLRFGTTVTSGRLPPEVIQRIVRQNFGRFRLCYEQGLTQNPNLEGRVQVRFVIDRTGAVSSATNGGSDLPSSGVVECVVRAYYGLSFPSPEGGIVTVVYPIMFSPG